jgi:hypothetical protein
MTKEQLQEWMKNKSIFECDIEPMCDFCSILLEARAKELDDTEPYATKTIKRYKDAANEVYELIDYIEEILEREN